MAKKETEGEALTPQQEKQKALQAALSKIEKDFGKGSIMRMGDENIQNVEVIPTGSIGLNAALGVGGYPKGRIIEIYGPESSGKTTLAIHAIAEAQKQGGIAAFIDAEHAFDRFYAQKLGVDVNSLLISQPDNGEQVYDNNNYYEEPYDDQAYYDDPGYDSQLYEDPNQDNQVWWEPEPEYSPQEEPVYAPEGNGAADAQTWE